MNQRDVELLSAYLDGQLKPSDSARLEQRLKTDPKLGSVLDDLRAARTMLRRLPQRGAPRNFTLTRKMVGQNPPLPRAYPAFRFATTLATLLLFLTFGLNFVAPQLSPQAQTFGMGGGGGAAESYSQEAPLAASAATEAPTEAPAEPPSALAPIPTQLAETPAADSARIAETPSEKAGNAANPNESPTPLVSSAWQEVLGVIAVIGALLMVLMRQIAVRRWK